LSHKAWHSIFEALFPYAASERSAYLKSKRGQKNTVHNRLVACAGALRTAVEVGVGKLRIRTVKAVLEHIIQTLPTSEGFCEPLSLDYVKSMRSILEYQPHVEHLRDTWNEVLAFCLNSLNSFGELGAEENVSLSTTGTSSGTPRDRLNRTSRYRMEAEELIACVRQLCRSPNAPIQDLAQESVTTLVHYLQQSSSAGRAHVDALSAVNLILARTSHTNIELTRQATCDVLPLLAELWATNSPHLRNEILSAMILTRPYVADLLRKNLDTEVQSSVGTLLEVLQGDYSKRPEREQLRIDDLRLRRQTTSTIATAPPDASVFRLRNGNVNSEARWTMVYFMALYCGLLDQSRADAHPVSAAGENPRKRLRISTNLHEHLRHSTSGTVSSQISSLQILSFMSTVMPLTVEQLDSIIHSLTTLVSDTVGSIATWTMLALAG
jgi:serine-protein kinase ATM